MVKDTHIVNTNTSYGYTAHDKVQDSTCVVGSEKDYRL